MLGCFSLFKFLYSLIRQFGLLHSIKLFGFIRNYLEFMTILYEFQNQGEYFDNIEHMLRKINPKMYTLTQNNFIELVKYHKLSDKIDHFSNLTCLKLLGQSNTRVTCLAGINHLFIDSYQAILIQIFHLRSFLNIKFLLLKLHG